MVSRASSKRLSIYDSLPVLDSWYPHQEEVTDQQDVTIIRSNTTSTSSTFIGKSSNERASQEGRRSVSFSVDPPSVHYINEDENDFSGNNNDVLLARRSTYHGGLFFFSYFYFSWIQIRKLAFSGTVCVKRIYFT